MKNSQSIFVGWPTPIECRMTDKGVSEVDDSRELKRIGIDKRMYRTRIRM
ncbi:hypothetical protein MGWOODY_Clf2743 [hydrothermal vent metagenome]|uniref:Uncharacterized protein n=1 Tax=hydrothermal vent metagenome TaxID=652676 RepID=A0A160V8S8_9ZZZZ